MQKVISNSSPLIHLSKIGYLGLLKDYFQRIVVPEAVYKECIVEGENREEVKFLKEANWIEVKQTKDKNLIKLLESHLDYGESEAIALALEIDADLILLDDLDARETARIYDLQITGTIGILLRAKFEGKIVSLKDTLRKLMKTGFWINKKLIQELLKFAGEI